VCFSIDQLESSFPRLTVTYYVYAWRALFRTILRRFGAFLSWMESNTYRTSSGIGKDVKHVKREA
jgi:hypothetical protein